VVIRPLHRDGPRLELVLIWWATAVVSVWDGGRQGQQLLSNAGVAAPIALWLVWAGALWDIAIGIWLAWWPTRQAYLVALFGLLAMTLVASWLLPQLWLDPFGPLLKNLAIVALLAQGLHRHA
jgi:hypothetical protein